MYVRVSARLHDRREPLLRDAHERVGGARRAHRVDRDADGAVRPVLEPDRERDARRELAVQLRLRRARADRAPRDEVRDVLRRDGVEQLGADGHAQVREVAEQLPPDA